MIRTQTEKMVTFYESDNEDCYNPSGNAKHPLNTTCERMYTVVGKVSNYDHKLQQGDIIKLGRTKFLVSEINILSQNEELKKQNERITRHRQQFTKKLQSGHITWKNSKLRKTLDEFPECLKFIPEKDDNSSEEEKVSPVHAQPPLKKRNSRIKRYSKS